MVRWCAAIHAGHEEMEPGAAGDAARFTFVAPEGAKRLDATLIEVNAIGDIVLKGK
jgi:hypothetical protein